MLIYSVYAALNVDEKKTNVIWSIVAGSIFGHDSVMVCLPGCPDDRQIVGPSFSFLEFFDTNVLMIASLAQT